MGVRWLGWFLLVLCVACGDDNKPPAVSVDEPMGDGGSRRCIDEDGDGAGRNCGRHDCDDNDPDVTDECLGCVRPNENCPCEAGTPYEYCVPEELGDERVVNGQLLQCTEGARYCREPAGLEGTFAWGPCVAIYTVK